MICPLVIAVAFAGGRYWASVALVAFDSQRTLSQFTSASLVQNSSTSPPEASQ